MDPWANLARIEASLQAGPLGTGEPEPAQDVAPSPPSPPLPPMRRDRSALRARSAEPSVPTQDGGEASAPGPLGFQPPLTGSLFVPQLPRPSADLPQRRSAATMPPTAAPPQEAELPALPDAPQRLSRTFTREIPIANGMTVAREALVTPPEPETRVPAEYSVWVEPSAQPVDGVPPAPFSPPQPLLPRRGRHPYPGETEQLERAPTPAHERDRPSGFGEQPVTPEGPRPRPAAPVDDPIVLDLLAPRRRAPEPTTRSRRSRRGGPDRSSKVKAPPPRPPAPPGGGSRRRLSVLATAAVMVLVLIGVWIGVDRFSSSSDDTDGRTDRSTTSYVPQVVPSSAPSTDLTPTAASASSVSAAWAAKVKLGVFRGTEPPKINAFGSWLGRDVDYVVDFSQRETWSDIANPTSMIDTWASSKYRAVYSTGLLPRTGNSSIASGAKGNYDANYVTLANHLIEAGEDDAIIRLGWEFNLETSEWATDRPTDFVSYWRHVVKAMRSVPGQHFQFDWNPNVGETEYDATLYYPGNAYVDYIGVDVYDVSWQEGTYPYPANCTNACRLARQKVTWERLLNGVHGLGFWAEFAHSKHKQMSLPEWGCWQRNDNHGGGDDPYFVEQMYRFIANPANNVAYQAYFETETDEGTHRLMTDLTAAATVYKKRFGR